MPGFHQDRGRDSVAAVHRSGTRLGYRNRAAPGTGAVTAPALNDPLPAGTGINWSISPAYPGPGACAITGAVGSQTLACNFGDMAGGGTAFVHVTSGTPASSCGTYSNTATLSATNNTSIPANATTTVTCPSSSLEHQQDSRRQLRAGAERGDVYRDGVQCGQCHADQRDGDGDGDGATGLTLVSMAGTGGRARERRPTTARGAMLGGGRQLPGDHGDGERGGQRRDTTVELSVGVWGRVGAAAAVAT